MSLPEQHWPLPQQHNPGRSVHHKQKRRVHGDREVVGRACEPTERLFGTAPFLGVAPDSSESLAVSPRVPAAGKSGPLLWEGATDVSPSGAGESDKPETIADLTEARWNSRCYSLNTWALPA